MELHGQHDDRGLLNPRGHRAILDAFGVLDGARAKVRKAWSEMARTRKAEAAAAKSQDEIRAEEEFLRYAVAELDKLTPKRGRKRSRYQAAYDAGAEKIRAMWSMPMKRWARAAQRRSWPMRSAGWTARLRKQMGRWKSRWPR